MKKAPRDAQRIAPVPTWVVAVLAVLSVGAITALVVGAWAVGQTWDENAMAAYTQGFFATGWFTDASAVVDGVVNPGYAWLYAYGPVANLLAHAGGVLLGPESWGALSFTSEGFAWRHVMTGVIGLVGVAAVSASVRILLGSWRWGLTAATLLLTTPLWLGHSMFNIKDVPVAAGFSLAVLGSILLATNTCEGSHRTRCRWLAMGAITFGAVLAAGTRPAIGAAIAGAVLAGPFAWMVGTRVQRHEWQITEWVRRSLWSLGALVTAYVVMALIYPRAFLNPVKLAYEALIVSGQFPFDEPVLTAGMWLEQPPPPYYLALWFGAQLPIVVITLGLLGVGLWLWAMTGRGRETIPTRAVPGLVPVMIQAAALPLAAIVLHSPIYNGSRQFLFAVPALVIIATVGLRGVLIFLQRLRWGYRWSTVVWALVVAVAAMPLIGAVQLLPYSYTYMNAVASVAPIDGRWPTDYWRASSNELMRILPGEGSESCAYDQVRNGEKTPCADQPMFKPYLDERGSEAQDEVLGDGEYWLVRENQGLVGIPQGCVVVDTIERENLWRTVTIGQILRCSSSAKVVG